MADKGFGPHWFKHNIGDHNIVAAKYRYTMLEIGARLSLKEEYWGNHDPESGTSHLRIDLISYWKDIGRISSDAETSALERILKCEFESTNRGYVHRSWEEDHQEWKRNKPAKSAAGKASGEASVVLRS